MMTPQLQITFIEKTGRDVNGHARSSSEIFYARRSLLRVVNASCSLVCSSTDIHIYHIHCYICTYIYR
jgi:hypothetical protein